MIVKNLIKCLQKMNPDAVVRLNGIEGDPVLFVLALQGDNSNVWLEGETGNDMVNEIQTRFDDAIENGTDELDVYAKMLEQGIDVDMVRKYLGEEQADHMKTFCEDHGLI